MNVGLKYYMMIIYSYNNDQNQICTNHHNPYHRLLTPTKMFRDRHPKIITHVNKLTPLTRHDPVHPRP